jgi:hypothetical protein
LADATISFGYPILLNIVSEFYLVSRGSLIECLPNDELEI